MFTGVLVIQFALHETLRKLLMLINKLISIEPGFNFLDLTIAVYFSDFILSFKSSRIG